MAEVSEAHEHWMRVALSMADEAARLGEVPVGAVLIGPEGEMAPVAATHQ